MSGNTFGEIFQIVTFGESHGPCIGVVIDGCPAGLSIDLLDIQKELDRRRPGQSSITTKRQEADAVSIVSGIYKGKTIGSPITLIIKNLDQNSEDYSEIETHFRPSHADYTYQVKYGFRDPRGGGRSSARETVARVMAGAVAKKLLEKYNIKIYSFVSQIGSIRVQSPIDKLDQSLIESNPVRCPEPNTAKKMIDLINETQGMGDSIGGIITGVIKNCPAGLGEPVFDKLHANLAKAMLSINAVKGFDYGSGFCGAEMMGSEHNDEFIEMFDKIKTITNYSGGIQGGISNGMDIYFRVAFKPVSTLSKRYKGRHDSCVLPRAVPIIDAMAALVIVDHFLRFRCSSVDGLEFASI